MIRRSVAAYVVAAVSLLPVYGGVEPAVAVSPPDYTHRAVLMTAGVKASVPGRLGAFHLVSLQAGLVDEFVPKPEADQPIYVEIRDFRCPTGFTVEDFLSQQTRCTQRGSTSAEGMGIPFVDDVPGQALGVRADLTTADGQVVPVDVRFDVTAPDRRETQVVADSAATWKLEEGIGGFSQVTGSVGGVRLSAGDSSTSTWAWASWQRYTATPWRAGRGAPQELGWTLNYRLVTQVTLTISRQGWWPGRRGNFHVASWRVDSDDYESILDPVTDYRCPNPARASATDPESSGCVAVGEGSGDDSSMVFDVTFGATLVLRQAGGEVTRFRPAGMTTVTVNEAFPSVTFRSGCAVTGVHTWSQLGRIRFGPKVRVAACDYRQHAYYTVD